MGYVIGVVVVRCFWFWWICGSVGVFGEVGDEESGDVVWDCDWSV